MTPDTDGEHETRMWSLSRREGDDIKGYTVLSIETGAVTIGSEGATHRLEIGDGVPRISVPDGSPSPDVRGEEERPAAPEAGEAVRSVEVGPESIESGTLIPDRVEPERPYVGKDDRPTELQPEPENIDELRSQASEFFRNLQGSPQFRESVERARQQALTSPPGADSILQSE